MVNLDTFYTNMIIWVQTHVKNPADITEGVICIRSRQNSPRPNDGLFCVLDVSSLAQKGRASTEVTSQSTNTISYSYHGTMVLSLDFIGEGALESAYKLRATLDHELTSSLFVAAGAGVFSVGDVLEITSLKDSRFEDRARFELGLNIAFHTDEAVDWIETVEVNGKTIGI